MRWVSVIAALSIVVLGAISIMSVGRIDSRHDDWRVRVRSRFYRGLPWGTVVVLLIVVCVYLFVQDGWTELTDPVVIPYRAWSYQYPLGMVLAPFSHASLGHLLGNLTAALLLAPIAEFAWGHYPRDLPTRPDSPMADPRLRAFVVFPVAVCGVALATSILAVGPVIGFSGVVFAFAGFAMVYYPIATIVAMLGGHGVVLTVIRAIQYPVTVSTVQGSPPSPPWWASVAIQAHALGFLLGVLLAIIVARRDDWRPDPVRFWIAVVLFGFSESLWAVYWYGSEGSYVLFRALGVVIVVALSLLVTVAVTAANRPLLTQNRERTRSLEESRFGDSYIGSSIVETGSNAIDALRTEFTGGRFHRIGRLSRRRTAITLLVLVLAVLSGPALAINAVTVDPGESEPALTVDEYAITYDESVENRLVSIVPIGAYGSSESITASGVIVWSTERSLWTDAVSAKRLAYAGSASVELGGPGWRETVTVERTGWDVVGNGSTYQVWFDTPSTDRTLAYESGFRESSVVINRSTITVGSIDGEYVLRVGNERSYVTREVPVRGESVTFEGVRIVRDGNQLVVEHEGTRAVVASRESYN